MPVNKLAAIPVVFTMLSWLSPMSAAAEVFKWIDQQGRVHFSDKKHANENAQQIDAGPDVSEAGANRLTIYPDADALLSENGRSPEGASRTLAVGMWSVSDHNLQNTSLMHFDLTNLLAAIRGGAGKRIVSAQLKLFTNSENTSGNQNLSSPPAPNLSGDNGLFLLPTRNNWEEVTITWSEFYSSNHYVPAAIRKLPSINVDSIKSTSKNYDVNLRDLLEQVTQNNLRELSFEIKLRRLKSGTMVAFYSREAEIDKRPVLVVELEGQANTAQ